MLFFVLLKLVFFSRVRHQASIARLGLGGGGLEIISCVIDIDINRDRTWGTYNVWKCKQVEKKNNGPKNKIWNEFPIPDIQIIFEQWYDTYKYDSQRVFLRHLIIIKNR